MVSARSVATVIRQTFDTDPGVTKVHKLLYYCQAWHLVWAGEPLFPEHIEAWTNGPVVATLWREERSGAIDDVEPLSGAQLRTVAYVCSRYGHLYATQLVGQTHQEDPWRETFNVGQNTVVSHDALARFFSADQAADQAWFWSPEWQAGELEADADVREGRTTFSPTVDELIEGIRAERADL